MKKKQVFNYFVLIKSRVTNEFKNLGNLSGRGKRYIKKHEPYLGEQAIKSGRKKKRQIDLTGINKIPTLDKCPVDKSPPSQ